MQVKKYISQKNKKADIKNRLDAYVRQGRSYRKTGRDTGISKIFLKSSLAALIPLASAAAADAQCLVPLTSAHIGTFTNNGSLPFDIDGDGTNDISVFARALKGNIRVYLRNVTSSISIVTAPSFGDVAKLAYGETIDAADNWKTSSFTRPLANIDNGNPPFSSGTGYIGIRKGGEFGFYGFIELETVSLTNSQYKFKIHKRGVDSPASDDNSALAGNCASIGGVLPVEMMYFRVQAQNGNIQLEWATATEQENAGFEIQRSTDGMHFHKIAWINGYGTSLEDQYYSFTDENIEANTSYYYRLLQYDLDGSFSHSAIKTALLKDDSKTTIGEVFPNPVSKRKGVAWLPTNLPEESPVIVTLFNSKGLALETFEEMLSVGSGNFPIPLYDLPVGIYYVKTQVRQQSTYRKLVVMD